MMPQQIPDQVVFQAQADDCVASAWPSACQGYLVLFCACAAVAFNAFAFVRT